MRFSVWTFLATGGAAGAAAAPGLLGLSSAVTNVLIRAKGSANSNFFIDLPPALSARASWIITSFRVPSVLSRALLERVKHPEVDAGFCSSSNLHLAGPGSESKASNSRDGHVHSPESGTQTLSYFFAV